MSVCYPTSMKIKQPAAEEQEKVPKLGAEGEVGFPYFLSYISCSH